MDALKVVGIVFSLIGLPFLAVGGGVGWSTHRFLQRAQSAPGRVVELAETRGSEGDVLYKPVVEYAVPDGRTARFTGRVASRPPSYAVGEAVAVLYAPEAPGEGRIDSFGQNWLLPLIFGGLGFLFTGIGQGLLWARVVRRRRNQWLALHGRRTPTRFQQVRLDPSIRVNGRSPFRIVSQRLDPASNTVQVFESDAIWFDPSPFVQPGAEIDVRIDPRNPKRYWMDTAFLPKGR